MESTENNQPEIRAGAQPKRRIPVWGWFLILGCGLNLVAVMGSLIAGFLFYYLPEQYANAPFDSRWIASNVNQLAFKDQKDFQTAQHQLGKAAFAPEGMEDPIPRLLLADLFNVMGKNGAAIYFYRQTLYLSESDWLRRLAMASISCQAHEKLALLYYEQGDQAASLSEIKAVGDLEQNAENPFLLSALQDRLEAPERADFHLALARELKSIYKLRQAQWEVQESIRLSRSASLKFQALAFQQTEMPLRPAKIPPLARYYMIAGNTLAEMDDLTGAATFYEKVIRETPDFEWGYNALASMFRKLRLYNQANETARKAIALNPGFYHPYLTLGDVSLDQSRFDDAIRHFQTGQALLAQSPTEEGETQVANVENQLAYAFECMKNYPQATKHYNRALIAAQQNESEDVADYDYARAGLARLAKRQ